MTYDLEAEKRLALALVLDPFAWDHVHHLLEAEMFGGEQSRAVFVAVQRAIRGGKPVTPITVQAEIVASGRSGSVVPGWAEGKACPRAETATLAKRVRDLWAARLLRESCAGAAETTNPPEETAAKLGEVLNRIQTGGAGGAQPISQLVYDWLTELEADANSPNATPVFYETGFKALDSATGGLARGELSVFAARPGSGKSSFVMALAVNFAAVGIPVGMFWLEDDWRDAARRFLARRLRLEAWRLRGKPGPALNYVASHENFLQKSELPLYVDDTHGLTVVDIQARMRRMAREHGVRVFILDHLGEVRIERDERWGDRHDLALGRVAREYRDTAKQLGAVPILVSQMNRRWEQRGTDTAPTMADLDGSGQVEQAARLIAFVQMYRGDDGAPTGNGALHVVKATGGQTGTVALKWNGNSMTWEEA